MFRTGEKVLCVESGPWDGDVLIEGETYIVKDSFFSELYEEMQVEIEIRGTLYAFWQWRFEKIVSLAFAMYEIS